MVVISAVEDAVEFGAFEGEVEIRNQGFFLFADFASELQVFAFGAFVAIVFLELVRSAGEDGLERGADSAEAGGLEGFVVSPEGGIDLVSTEIELFGSVADFAIEVAEEAAESDKDEEENDTAGGDFDNRSLGYVAGCFFHGAI